MKSEKRLNLRDIIQIGNRDHYQAVLRKRHGEKYSEHLNKIAKKLGFKSYYDYVCHWRESKGNFTQEQYLEKLAHRKGVETAAQYQKKLMRDRARTPRYKHFAGTLIARLEKLHMSVPELSRKTGINRTNIYAYCKGYFYPKPERLKIIADALEMYHLIPPEKEPPPSRIRTWYTRRPLSMPLRNWEMANHIRDQMKKLSISRAELEKRTGATSMYYVRWGLTYPSLNTLKKLSKVLDVSKFLPRVESK